MPNKTTIVCLCGSVRFHEEFQLANFRETLAGNIVLAPAFLPSAECHAEMVGITPEQKAFLDAGYLRKVELADEILVINVGQYIGESTAKEIAHAKALGKRIRYLEPPDAQ
jgi:hypothetical protein